ncbi:uncharacterized protein [Macrobrachium rosenbergii]|uniref:uncharacterized protein n=1 Tax=Macrobrachium rosenbergii TaxID=79674 RepID=UPI0034D47648
MTSPSGSKYVLEGSNVTLTCEFDLEGDELYSLPLVAGWQSYISLVKPANSSGSGKEERAAEDIVVFDPISNITTRPLAWFPVDGVHATLCSKGWGEELCLLEVNPSAGGIYTCEVTTEAPPTFLTANASVSLHVVVPPLEAPIMSSTPGIVSDGEWLSVQCDSPPALPAPNISFFINQKPVVDDLMSGVQVTGSGDERLVVSRSVGFIASEALFIHGHLVLECRVSIEELTWRTSSDILLEGYNGQSSSTIVDLKLKCILAACFSFLMATLYR